MPGFPSAEKLKAWIGSSGTAALQEIYPFYRIINRYYELLEIGINENTTLLDFGCGWGRIMRFFHPDNILGVDVNEDVLSFCKSHILYGNFSKINPESPPDIEGESIDIITLYSVFTHLREKMFINGCVNLKYSFFKSGGYDKWNTPKVY